MFDNGGVIETSQLDGDDEPSELGSEPQRDFKGSRMSAGGHDDPNRNTIMTNYDPNRQTVQGSVFLEIKEEKSEEHTGSEHSDEESKSSDEETSSVRISESPKSQVIK